MKLEQSEQERAVYSKQESNWKNGVGVKRVGKGGLLQVGKQLEKWSWSKASRKGRLAPNRKVVGKMELE